MKTIEYISLYNYLTQVENQKPWEAVHVLMRLRKISPELLLTLNSWIDGDTSVDVKRQEVSFSELVQVEGMQPTQAILMLDWIERDLVSAMQYMTEERFRSPLDPLTDEEEKKMQQAVDEFKKRGLHVEEKVVPESLEQLDESEKQDIEVDF